VGLYPHQLSPHPAREGGSYPLTPIIPATEFTAVENIASLDLDRRGRPPEAWGCKVSHYLQINADVAAGGACRELNLHLEPLPCVEASDSSSFGLLGTFAMPELIHDTWDAPPIPQHGDLDENSTYAGVGRVLSGWEAMEAELSHLYAAFVGKFHQAEAYREYGAGGQIFANRMLTLRTSAQN
jgi:hypothetical protein